MKKVILKIDGMSCSACSNGLEKYLNQQKDISHASVNLVLAQAMIEYNENIGINELEHFIEEAGFKSLGIYDSTKEEKKDVSKGEFIFFGVLGLILFYIAMSHMLKLPVIPALHMLSHPIRYAICLCILTIPFLWYGRDIFQKGIKSMIHKSPNMDTLVTLGVSASFLYSFINMILIILGHHEAVEYLYFESCAMVIYFLKIGRFIDLKSKEKTKEATQQLVQITPTKALLKENMRTVSLDEVQKGDILVAKPGMKIAVDGMITKGMTHIEESFITGESRPIKKQEKDSVLAGSINLDGYIEYKAEKIGKDSTISEIVRLVQEAIHTKSPIMRIADRVSGYFVPGILLLAIFTFLGYLLLGRPFDETLQSFVTVLVVACPCALGLATPLAIVVSEGECAKRGILIKNSETLENAYKIDTIVLDKTGTLTYGDLKVSQVFYDKSYSKEEVLKMVANIEAYSTHPIAKAFSKKNNFVVNHFKNMPGLGLYGIIDKDEIYVGNDKCIELLKIPNPYLKEAKSLTDTGNSLIYVILNKKVIGLIGVRDIVRTDAKTTINKLKKMHKRVIMLTGDNESTAHRIAKDIGIEEVIADVLPQEKAHVIDNLIQNGAKVMMVGDGVNDAPALVHATIGVSFYSGTDIAANSASIIFMHDMIEKLPEIFSISSKTIKIIHQNLFWAFFYNVCMIPIAIGFLKPFHIVMNPMVASIAMVCSSLTVVFNTLRLKRILK